MPCDPFEMALVHGGFRRELHNATDLIRGVPAGNRRRAGVVARHIDFMMTAVHFHHSAEDEFVWPRLSNRAPADVAECSRMTQAHRAIDDACEQVRSRGAGWAATGEPRHADKFASLVGELTDIVDTHFDDEEEHVVPLIGAHLGPKEWQKFLSHGSAFVRAHPRRGLALGGIVLDGAPAATRSRFLGNLPMPLRAVFNLVGDRVYAGYRAQVYGP